MNRRFVKLIYKLFITISVLECIYLFVLPPVLQKIITQDKIFSFIENNSNVNIEADKVKLKTHILPKLSIQAKNIKTQNKNSGIPLISADDIDFEFNILPLIFKQFKPSHFYADKLKITLKQNDDGSYNFDNLFQQKNNSKFKIKYKNFMLKTEGEIITNNSQASFDTDLKFSMPFSFKNFNKDELEGSAFLYNVKLKEFEPLAKRINPEIKTTDGIIDFIQLSADKQKNKTQVVVNTKFNNVTFDRNNWTNHIFAKDENKVNATVDLYDSIIDIKRFKYDADKIDISGYGTIDMKSKPVLDLSVKVKDSRTENIASLLPPDLVKETMIFEKIKKYGIYGDMEGEAQIKGEVPQPDIIGYAKGRNIHILEAKYHKLHTGTVDLTFDKRKLHMDILVEMPNNQKATVKGTTYMFRDGLNDISIKSTNNLDIPLAHTLAIPISKVFAFQLGPLPDMKITSGKGKMDLYILSSLDTVDFDGFFTFNNANLTYNGIYGNITNGKGKLDFKKDTIYIKSDRAFIQNNPFNVDGTVKINDNLNFNLEAKNAKAVDLLEIIKKSDMLKDVKKGLALFNKAEGLTNLSMNISANIVPVPFGQPPLPPEEAFTDMKVKGVLDFLGNRCYLEGFRIPVDNIRGLVNFTETVVDFSKITASVESSDITIDGKIVNDIKTKIPDVDLTIKGDSINIGDTVKFLTESYFYPKNYPDISSFYNLETKHDLYLKYKAKSADFLTNKVYAVMNIKKDEDENSVLRANSGKIILDKAIVSVQNVNADIFDSTINIAGNVKRVDTIHPLYNLVISSDKFNLENLNRIEELEIIPASVAQVLNSCGNYKGYMEFSTKFNNNVTDTDIDFKGLSFVHNKTQIPFVFDDFSMKIFSDKITAENVTADVANMPVFANISLSDIFAKPNIKAYITTKLNNEFIQNYFGANISNKINISGEINLSSEIEGTADNLKITPNLVLYPNADAVISGVSIGDTSDKREFTSNIKIRPQTIDIENLDYYKYITNQNNAVYPVLFAYGNGMLKENQETGNYEPKTVYIKTEKSLSAKLLNIFLDKPLLKQGMVNCDLKYNADSTNGKVSGNIEARNIDIPIVDTIIKTIKADTDDGNINIRLFGFLNDTALRLKTVLGNELPAVPKIKELVVIADKVNINKLLNSIDGARTEYRKNHPQTKELNLTNFEINNGELHVDELTLRNYTAENVNSKFSISKDGLLHMHDINIKLGEGSATGEVYYDIDDSDLSADLEFKNIDANDFAENLFDAKNQIYGNANANFIIKTCGNSDEEMIKNLSGYAYFDIADGRMPKLGSLEYLLRASNIITRGVTGFTLNNVLEILNIVKTGQFSSISGSAKLENGIAKDLEIFSQGDNMSLYLHGDYDISSSIADMEILGNISNKISTIFGPIGNTSLNTLFKLIPGVSLIDFGRKDIIENVEKIPSLTNGDYDEKTFQAIIKGDINSLGYVQSFRWIKK